MASPFSTVISVSGEQVRWEGPLVGRFNVARYVRGRDGPNDGCADPWVREYVPDHALEWVEPIEPGGYGLPFRSEVGMPAVEITST